jgi:hypothetical protein
MESASWEKAGFEVERVDESVETEERLTYGIDESQGGRKRKTMAKMPMAKKPMAKKMEEADEVEDAEEISEDVHVCPLCVSQLEEPIDEERLVEHLDVVFGLADPLSQLNEGDEDVEEVIANALTDLLFDEEDED